MRRLALLSLAPLLAACQPVDGVGYVEVKRIFAPQPSDIYRLNGLALDELRKNASVVIRQKAGKVKLDLDRAGALTSLCVFELGRNRIATATIAVVDGRLKCAVQL